MAETIIKCKYAGDPSDEGCKKCDGIQLIENGATYDATECGGYEPEEQGNKPAPQEEPSLSNETVADSCESDTLNTQPTVGITSVIRAESGLTREINGTYYKFMFSEERILPEGCDIEAEKQALWEAVNAEVDAQLEAVRS